MVDGSISKQGDIKMKGAAGNVVNLADVMVSGTIYSGTKSATAVAAALAATQTVVELLVQNDPSNSADLIVGNATAQAVTLRPGQSLSIPCSDLALLFVKASAGTVIANYIARG